MTTREDNDKSMEALGACYSVNEDGYQASVKGQWVRDLLLCRKAHDNMPPSPSPPPPLYTSLTLKWEEDIYSNIELVTTICPLV